MTIPDLEALELFGQHGNYPGQLIAVIESRVRAELLRALWVPVEVEKPQNGVHVLAVTASLAPEVLEYWETGPNHQGASGWYDAQGNLVGGVSHWMPTPAGPIRESAAPFAGLDITEVTPMTLRKTRDIQTSRGYAISGFVLSDEQGRKCIVDMNAVRWMDDPEEFFKLMHPPAS